MTVLSRALTAETPKERYEAMLVELGFSNGTVQRSHFEPREQSTLIEQFYTNERTLFDAAVKGQIDIQQMPNHMDMIPLQSPTSTPSERPVPSEPSAGAGVTTPAVAAPPNAAPPAPKSNGHPRTCLCNDCAKLEGLETKPDGRVDYIQSMTVDEAKNALGSALTLSKEQFRAWQRIPVERRKAVSTTESGFWPTGYSQKLTVLERLSPSERYWLVKA